jgi:Ca2+:H+ antiporter
MLGDNRFYSSWSYLFVLANILRAEIQQGFRRLILNDVDYYRGRPGNAFHVQHCGRQTRSGNEFAVSVILGIIYLLSLFYTLVTHKHLFVVKRETPQSGTYRPWPFRAAVVILLVSAVVAGLESSFLVDSITPLISTLGITQTFAGLVLIALLTNIPEQISAARFARMNNMTLSLEIGMSSALQIALFVVPILVLLSSTLTGQTMDLVLSPFELISLVMTAMIANYISADGICHWLEGAQLLAVYALIATAFYFI